MSASSILKQLVRSLFRRAGFEITKLENDSGDRLWLDGLGGREDPFSDIKRLSQAWNYPIKCFFDVGANDGATTRAALLCFADIRVYAFEPHPHTFLRLRENIPGTRFHPFNMALGDRAGSAELFSCDNDKINSLVQDAPFATRFKQRSKPINVEISTIDDFCAAHGIAAIDVLKIDTEGYDLFVLKGAAQKLANQEIKFVYAEFNDVFEHAGITGGTLFSICEYLYPFGFRLIATYTDCLCLETKSEFFSVHNALFALPPSSLKRIDTLNLQQSSARSPHCIRSENLSE